MLPNDSAHQRRAKPASRNVWSMDVSIDVISLSMPRTCAPARCMRLLGGAAKAGFGYDRRRVQLIEGLQ